MRDDPQTGISDFIFLTTEGDEVHTCVLLCPNLPAALLGSIQQTAHAGPSTSSTAWLLSAPILMLQL